MALVNKIRMQSLHAKSTSRPKHLFPVAQDELRDECLAHFIAQKKEKN
jgi:hypothetical protein